MRADRCPGVGCPPLAAPAFSPLRAVELLPVQPNPGRAPARVALRLAAAAHVRLDIIDVTGRRVVGLADGVLSEGNHERWWSGRHDDGRRVPPGVYFAQLQAGPLRHTRRFVLLD